MALHTYLPQDRLRAIANHVTLPDRTSGSALFADISGFTAFTESLRNTLGSRRGAEELTRQIEAVYSGLITQIELFRLGSRKLSGYNRALSTINNVALM